MSLKQSSFLVITVLNTAILLEEREGYIYVQQQTKQEVAEISFVL